MKIAIIGTGYVGLVTGAGLAEYGHDVTCVDIDAERIRALCGGVCPIHEPGLPDLVRRNRELGRLHFTTSVDEAMHKTQVVFIAVGTPSRPDGSAELAGVLGAARDIARALKGFTVIVTKSTVPVGTAELVRKAVSAETRLPFAIASNPEFLKEGDAVNDFVKPSRIVVGAKDPRAIEAMRELYRGMLRINDRLMVMDLASAELTKYAANAMLATRISFMNELAQLAESVGADIELVRQGVGSDPRIGPKFLFAGAGFGGSCFPKDLRALVHTGHAHQAPLTIVEAVDRANEAHKRHLGTRIISHFDGSLVGHRIAIWGLSFKPETDDIRESPALTLIEQLRAAGASVAAYDPAAMPNVRALLGDAIELVSDPYDAAAGADALVLVTEWHALREPDLERLARLMRQPVLFDGRNVWSPDETRRAGFLYYGIGRAPAAPIAARRLRMAR